MADEFKRKGNEFFKQGKFEDAVTWYSKAIQAEPRNEMLYSNRAASYTSLRKDLEALKDAEMCVELKPAWIKGYFRKGVALSNLNRLNEAVTAFEEALKIEPGNPDVQQRLTDTRNTLKTQVSNSDPSRERNPDECKKMGNTQFKNGQYPSAIAWYTRAVELTEANPTEETAVYLCNRAACHAQTHSYKQVVADCDSAIAINEKFAKAYLRRAMAFEALEKWQKAANDYKKVMEIEPSAAGASQGYHRALKFAKDMM